MKSSKRPATGPAAPQLTAQRPKLFEKLSTCARCVLRASTARRSRRARSPRVPAPRRSRRFRLPASFPLIFEIAVLGRPVAVFVDARADPTLSIPPDDQIVHIQGGQCGNQIGAKFWEVCTRAPFGTLSGIRRAIIVGRVREDCAFSFFPASPLTRLLLPHDHRLSAMSTVSTPPAPTAVTPTSSWSASTSTTTRRPAVRAPDPPDRRPNAEYRRWGELPRARSFFFRAPILTLPSSRAQAATCPAPC